MISLVPGMPHNVFPEQDMLLLVTVSAHVHVWASMSVLN